MSEEVTDRDSVLHSWGGVKRFMNESWVGLFMLSLLLLSIAFGLFAFNSTRATNDVRTAYEDAMVELEMLRRENMCQGEISAEIDIALADFLLIKGNLIIQEGKALIAVATDNDNALQAAIPQVREAIVDAEMAGEVLRQVRDERRDLIDGCTG